MRQTLEYVCINAIYRNFLIHRCILNDTYEEGGLKLSEEYFSVLQEKNLVINIYKNGIWGSFRHIPIEEGKRNEKFLL